MDSILQVRIDKDTKQKASKILNKYRIDLSTAIRLFLNKLIKDNCVSDDLLMELYAQEAKDDANIEEAKQDGLDVSYQEIDFLIHMMHLQEEIKSQNIDINQKIDNEYLELEKQIIEKIKNKK